MKKGKAKLKFDENCYSMSLKCSLLDFFYNLELKTKVASKGNKVYDYAWSCLLLVKSIE